jgi:WD40 repeat protein
VLIYDSVAGTTLRRVALPDGGIIRLGYHPRGEWLAVGTKAGRVLLIEPEKGEVMTRWQAHRGTIHSLTIRPDGGALATTGSDAVRVWQAPSGKELASHKTLTAWASAFSPDGLHLATAEEDRVVRLREALTGEVIRSLDGHSERPSDIAFSPDGKRLVSGGLDRTVRVWDVESGQELLSLPGVVLPVSRVAWSRDGRRIVAYDIAARLWETPR